MSDTYMEAYYKLEQEFFELKKKFAESEEYSEKQAHYKGEAYAVITTLQFRIDNLEKALSFAHKHLESMDNYSVVSGTRHIIDKALSLNDVWFRDKPITADDMKFMEDMNRLPQPDPGEPTSLCSAHAFGEERARSANNKVLRETLGNAAMRIWTVYRDLDKVTNVVQREMLYNLNNEIQRVLGDTK
jgi:hypothetical protein